MRKGMGKDECRRLVLEAVRDQFFAVVRDNAARVGRLAAGRPPKDGLDRELVRTLATMALRELGRRDEEMGAGDEGECGR